MLSLVCFIIQYSVDALFIDIVNQTVLTIITATPHPIIGSASEASTYLIITPSGRHRQGLKRR